MILRLIHKLNTREDGECPFCWEGIIQPYLNSPASWTCPICEGTGKGYAARSQTISRWLRRFL